MLKYEIAGQNKEDTASIRKLLKESGNKLAELQLRNRFPGA
jgi:hypothetical protein